MKLIELKESTQGLLTGNFGFTLLHTTRSGNTLGDFWMKKQCSVEH